VPKFNEWWHGRYCVQWVIGRTNRASLIEKGLNDKTVNDMLNVLSKPLRYAVDVDVLVEAPKVYLLKLTETLGEDGQVEAAPTALDEESCFEQDKGCLDL